MQTCNHISHQRSAGQERDAAARTGLGTKPLTGTRWPKDTRADAMVLAEYLHEDLAQALTAIRIHLESLALNNASDAHFASCIAALVQEKSSQISELTSRNLSVEPAPNAACTNISTGRLAVRHLPAGVRACAIRLAERLRGTLMQDLAAVNIQLAKFVHRELQGAHLASGIAALQDAIRHITALAMKIRPASASTGDGVYDYLREFRLLPPRRIRVHSSRNRHSSAILKAA